MVEAGEEETESRLLDLRDGTPMRDVAATTVLPLHPHEANPLASAAMADPQFLACVWRRS
jgi:hypothetical protein